MLCDGRLLDHVGRLRAAPLFLRITSPHHLTPRPMAIKLRLLGTVTDAARSLTYTRSGMPRFSFGVRVGALRSRHYLITAYGTMARFCDIYLRTGQRVHVEGAYLRRFPAFEGLIRGDTIRHVGGSVPPFPGTVVRFVPQTPITEPADAARPVPHAQADATSGAATSRSAIDAAVAAAMN